MPLRWLVSLLPLRLKLTLVAVRPSNQHRLLGRVPVDQAIEWASLPLLKAILRLIAHLLLMQDEWLVMSWAISIDAAFSLPEPLFVDLVALHRLDRLLGLHFGLHRRLALIYLDQLTIVNELVAFTADL